MSLKLLIVFSFLLVQVIYGQNIFGFQLPFFGGGGASKSNVTSGQLGSGNDTLMDDIDHEHYANVPTHTSAPNTDIVVKPGWNYFIPTIDLNGFPIKLLKAVPDLNKISLVLITRVHCDHVTEQRVCKYTQSRFSVIDGKELLKDSNFDKKRKTVIYFYGYEDHMESEATQLIIEAYLQRDDHNLLICDYWELVANLKDGVANIELMAKAIAHMIYEMNAKGFDLSLLHLVGHAIGAQMAGSVGKEFIEQTEGTKLISRITGLDPQFVFFYPPIGRHITAKDAIFVDIIHTDAWSYGAPVATGTVDFWPNSGSDTQPGCPPRDRKLSSKVDMCSHYRAVRFWAESLLTENAFLSMKCSSWSKFKKTICDPRTTAYMGCEAKPSISGNYYLQTNGQQPFSRKHHGIIYDNIA